MRLMALAFLAGVWLIARSPSLPDAGFVQMLPICLLCVAFRSPAAILAAVGCGLSWATLHAHQRLAGQLPAALEGRNLVVEGIVADVPYRDHRALRLMLNVERVVDGGPNWQGRARLSWYRPDEMHDASSGATPRAGQRLRLGVRLARPRGFVNPAGFDYEGWLFVQGVAATGYVRHGAANRAVGESTISLHGIRQVLFDRMDEALANHPHLGFLQAITLGVRVNVTPKQWEVLRATGTAHLMAISGLHIGLVSGLVFMLVRRLWTLDARCVRLLPAGVLAAGMAVAAGVAYAALAGFSVPTQRALVMVIVAMAALATRRSIAPTTGVAVALLAVLSVDPMAVISPGFWLSFVAVAAILYGSVGYGAGDDLGSSGGGGHRSRGARLWWRWGRVHLLISVALLPLALLFFGRFPWLSPVANLVAVPWIGITVVPLALLGVLLLAFHVATGTVVLRAAAFSLDLLWPLLEHVADLEAFVYAAGPTGGWTLVSAAIGTALLLMPRALPVKVVGIAWLLPLLWPSTQRPAPSEIWLTLMDVGQGLAVVVRTRNHVLLYDAGPRFSERFDAGSAVIVPYLRHRGVRRIDTLVVSHGHNDHLGGVDALLERGLVGRLVTNVDGWELPADPCWAGAGWDWDGVEFDILHPAHGATATGNDASCVVRIAAPGISILLPGDIELAAERTLVAIRGEELRSSVLLLAHHGSATSTGPPFLDAVRPCVALISRGHRNRFGFPDARVLRRLAVREIPWLDTAVHGAIEVKLGPNATVRSLGLRRVDERRFWHRFSATDASQRRPWLERISHGQFCTALPHVLGAR